MEAVIIRCYKCKRRMLVDGDAYRAKQLGWLQRRVMVPFNGREHLSVLWFCGKACDPKAKP